MKCEICNNEILKDSYNIQDKWFHNNCILVILREKQDLIKYLEDTIKKHKKFDKKNNCEWQGYYFYQEILDKIKEGNYE